MKKYFYVAADYEKDPEKKNFNIWAFADATDDIQVIKAIDTAFYLNAKYSGIILKYGFTDSEKEVLMIDLNRF